MYGVRACLILDTMCLQDAGCLDAPIGWFGEHYIGIPSGPGWVFIEGLPRLDGRRAMNKTLVQVSLMMYRRDSSSNNLFNIVE